MRRIDLEQASCDDPECEADHGYTGSLVGDDLTVRMSAAAEGAERVAHLVRFGSTLQRVSGSVALTPVTGPLVDRLGARRPGVRVGTLTDLMPSIGAHLGVPGSTEDVLGLPNAHAMSWCSSTDWAGIWSGGPSARCRTWPRCSGTREPMTVGCAQHHGDQPRQPRHRAAARPARHGRLHQPGAVDR